MVEAEAEPEVAAEAAEPAEEEDVDPAATAANEGAWDAWLDTGFWASREGDVAAEVGLVAGDHDASSKYE